MDKLKYIKLENEDGTYSDSIPLSVQADYVDINENTNLADYVEDNDNDIAHLQAQTTNNTTAIQGLASGSPKGTYATVADLVSANPATGVYIVTADGHIYSWVKNAVSAIDLGVYQATAIADDSVSYSKISPLLKETDFYTLTPTDLLWKSDFSVTDGDMVYRKNTILSQAFLASKGDTIDLADGYTGKVIYYDFSKHYVKESGSFAALSNYKVEQDGYIKICIAKTGIVVADLYNDIISFSTLRQKNYEQNLINGLIFSKHNDSKIYSNLLYVGKGTKITLTDSEIFNANNTQSDSIVFLGVREYYPDKKYGDTNTFYNNNDYKNTDYIVTKDGYVRLYLMMKWGPTLAAENYHKFRNAIEIDYVAPITQPSIDYSNYTCVLGNNKAVDIIERPGMSGSILFKLSGTLAFYCNSELIWEKSWASIKEDFSSKVVTYNGDEYIKLDTYQEIIINLNTRTLEINSFTRNSADVPGHIIVLLKNLYENVCDGRLLTYYLKQQMTTYNSYGIKSLFNSGAYLSSVSFDSIKDFTDLFNNGSTNIETFVFYTDQHLLGTNNDLTSWVPKTQRWMSTLLKAYNSIPANFIVSGGDWLNWDDDEDSAMYKMGYVDGFTKMFKNHHMILGNHDTNYQGTTRFSNSTITNLWFREYGKNYYKFKGCNSMNYVLDTGDGNYMNTYEWTQLNWLASQLSEDDPDHATVMLHIIWHDSQHTLAIMADNITKLIKAYNDHTTITLNNVSYDFTNKTGHVDYVLSGHTHYDYSATINGVLCISTTTFAYYTDSPNFDMIFNDYDNHKAYFIRFGDGENREFDI